MELYFASGKATWFGGHSQMLRPASLVLTPASHPPPKQGGWLTSLDLSFLICTMDQGSDHLGLQCMGNMGVLLNTS